MKLLVDPVYTSDPGHCASNVKMRKCVEAFLAAVPDGFVYWIVPLTATPAQRAWYPQTPRIKLVDYDYSVDRLREYVRVTREYESLVSFWGKLWDVDVLLTNRTSFVPHVKMMMTRSGRKALDWSKRVFLIEDMPIMSFKKKLGDAVYPMEQDLVTLLGYLSSDKVAISAFWEKEEILAIARNLLMPSLVRQINEKMIETSSVKATMLKLRPKAAVEKMLSGERPFTVGYVGRMIVDSRATEIFKLMNKKWAVSGQKMRFYASTVSFSTGRVKVPSCVEIHRPSRERFWELVHEEMDVFIFMSKEEDYSLSLMEPLMLGCPCILIRDKWSVATVGEDYPFFVDGFTEAYKLLHAFHTDYVKLYAKFAEWHRTKLHPLLAQRDQVYLPDVFMEQITKWRMGHRAWTELASVTDNSIVQLIAKVTRKTVKPFVMLDVVEELGAKGKLSFLARKVGNGNFNQRVRARWQTDWGYFRLGLLALGYKDAGVEPGTLVRV